MAELDWRSESALLSGDSRPPGLITMSTVPLRRAVIKRMRDRSTVANSMYGERFLKSSGVARKFPADIEVQKPIERRPASPRPLCRPVSTSASTCSRTSLAIRKTFDRSG